MLLNFYAVTNNSIMHESRGGGGGGVFQSYHWMGNFAGITTETLATINLIRPGGGGGGGGGWNPTPRHFAW